MRQIGHRFVAIERTLRPIGNAVVEIGQDGAPAAPREAEMQVARLADGAASHLRRLILECRELRRRAAERVRGGPRGHEPAPRIVGWAKALARPCGSALPLVRRAHHGRCGLHRFTWWARRTRAPDSMAHAVPAPLPTLQGSFRKETITPLPAASGRTAIPSRSDRPAARSP